MQTIHFNQPPNKNQSQPEITMLQQETNSTTQELKELQQNQEAIPLVEQEDYLSNLTAKERRPSADTIVNTETGEKTANPVAQSVVEEKPKMDVAEAKSKTERMLKFRDFLQKWLLAWAAGDVSQKDNFGMAPWEFAMLADVYNDVIVSIGHIPKWFDILIAETMIMGPKIAKVIGHRNMLAEMKRKDAIIARYEQQYSTDTSGPLDQSYRIDAKKWWEIDADGYFLYDKTGYLTKDKKTVKPDISDPAQLEMVVKYNGAEKVNKIFGV